MFTITKIIEIFSSIQGEGKKIGKRQIFIRFAGCNINCNYCDTTESIKDSVGFEYSYDELNTKIQQIITDDFDSLEITGGEPLLQADYIHGFLKKYPYPAMLETNATLPIEMMKLTDVINLISMDIKLPEHVENWDDVYTNELKTIEVLTKTNTPFYVKIVITPKTPLKVLEKIREDIAEITQEVEIIIQPVSPISQWHDKTNIFKASEIMGEKFSVAVIPQIHKYLEVE